MSVAIRIEGKEGVHRMLEAYTDPKLTKRLSGATKDAAKVFVPPLKSEAKGASRRMASAVKVRANKKDKPGWHVAFRSKDAYFKHMVIRGTKAHGPKRSPAMVFVPGWNPYMKRSPRAGKYATNWVRVQNVRGVRGNDMVSRVANKYETQAWAAFDKSLDSTEAR